MPRGSIHPKVKKSGGRKLIVDSNSNYLQSVMDKIHKKVLDSPGDLGGVPHYVQHSAKFISEIPREKIKTGSTIAEKNKKLYNNGGGEAQLSHLTAKGALAPLELNVLLSEHLAKRGIASTVYSLRSVNGKKKRVVIRLDSGDFYDAHKGRKVELKEMSHTKTKDKLYAPKLPENAQKTS